MPSTESNAWSSAVDPFEVVVGIGDMHGTSVFVSVAVTVADERRFVVVVEVDIADCDPIACVRDLDLVSVDHLWILLGKDLHHTSHHSNPCPCSCQKRDQHDQSRHS